MQVYKKILVFILVFVLICSLMPSTLSILASQSVTDVSVSDNTSFLDLDDLSVFDFYGSDSIDDIITQKIDSNGDIYYEMVGKSTIDSVNQYNKIYSKQKYSGNTIFTFNIQFTSTSATQMFFATPRGVSEGVASNTFPSSITSNFVLHSSGSGQRLIYTDTNGESARSHTTDKAMTELFGDKKTGYWYSVKIEITDTEYKTKYWLAGEEEPEAYNCTMPINTADAKEGFIGFAKRGTGAVLLKNVNVTTITPEVNSAYLHTINLDPSQENWVHNQEGVFLEQTGKVIRLGGGGSNRYNKIISTTSFKGDFCLQFDIKFLSTDSTEMVFFTGRYNPLSLGADRYTGSPYCNFVLHASNSGLRMGHNGTNNASDTVMSEMYADTLTNTWFTVKLVLEGNEYKCKYWLTDTEEPSTWNCSYIYEDIADFGPLSFSKRGMDAAFLRRISVSYNDTEDFIAQSVEPLCIDVPYNTREEDLNLPAFVNVFGTNSVMAKYNVVWDLTNYDPLQSGEQIINGTILLAENANPQQLTATAKVTVGAKNAVFYASEIWTYGEHPDVTTYHQFGTTVTKSGTILATCEARVAGGDADNPCKVVLKRSEDGGKTWGETIVIADYAVDLCSEFENDCGKGIYGHFYANPTPVVDYETGTIYLFYSENFSSVSSRLYYRISTDDGKTWSEQYELTSLFDSDPYARKFHLPGPGHGIQIQNGKYKGRLVVEVWHRHSISNNTTNRQYGLSVIYSDDGGLTWQNSAYIDVGYNMNEGRIAELAGGVLVINSRAMDDTRKQTYSTDGGVTWSTPVTWESIGSYANCDSGFISSVTADGTELVTVHQYGTDNRDNLYAFVSYDNGKTWIYSKQIWSKTMGSRGTGASDVYLIDKNTYGVVHADFWGRNNVEFIVFNTSYVSNVDEPTQIMQNYLYDAQIGVENYTDLSQAVLAAVKRDTIVLRQDILMPQTIAIDKEIFLDLNGYSLWTDDINALCATGYTVKYHSATGLYQIQKKSSGDLNQDGKITDADAVYLLMHTFFPSTYPLEQSCDFNKDGELTDSDAVYLLMHTFFPKEYPIS